MSLPGAPSANRHNGPSCPAVYAIAAGCCLGAVKCLNGAGDQTGMVAILIGADADAERHAPFAVALWGRFASRRPFRDRHRD